MKRWWLRRKAAKLERHIRAIFDEIEMMTDVANAYAARYAKVMAKLREYDNA